MDETMRVELEERRGAPVLRIFAAKHRMTLEEFEQLVRQAAFAGAAADREFAGRLQAAVDAGLEDARKAAIQ